MKTPNLDNLSKEVTEYIAHLEASLHGTSELMKAIHVASNVIAQEILDKVAKGDVMSDDKSFDKIMQLIEKASKVRALSEPKKKEDKPEEEEQPEIQETPEERVVMRNISDLAKKRRNEG